MQHKRHLGTALSVMILTIFVDSHAEVKEATSSSFTIVHEVILPATPEEVYDATTGDISGWWDHNFSGNPNRFYIEAKPGGGFYEIFDDSGDGALHATVIYAHRGKLLRFTGPLGLQGDAVQLVWTLQYQSHPDGTRLTMTGTAHGTLKEGMARTVDQVWHHFLVERLKPFIEAGNHRKHESN